MRYIYILIDPENKNIGYVGQTNNLKRRYNTHLTKCMIESDCEYQTYKSRWLRKLISNGLKPIIEVLDFCENLEQSNEREKFWIDKMSQNGFELTNSHPTDVTEFSLITRQKMSSVRKGKKLEDIIGKEKAEKLKIYNSERIKLNNPNKSDDPLVKEKISKSLKKYFLNPENHWAHGRKMNEDHIEKLRKSKIGNPKNVGNRNPRTNEQKQKLRDKILGTKVERHIILQLDIENNLIKEWKSMREIERKTDFSRLQISRCCKGLKKYYGGFIWKYKPLSL